MTSLMVMAKGWHRHLRVLFRALAASLALAVALGVAYERPDVIVIFGPPPTATGLVQSIPAPMPVAARTHAPRRRPALTRAVAPRSAHAVLTIGRLDSPPPPDLRSHRPGPPLYLAHLRILC